MKVVIVGHGPSLKTAGLGAAIDQCDKVVRLKNSSYLLAEPQNYGTRTDALCTSTETLYNLSKMPAVEYWGYPKNGDYSASRVMQATRQIKADILIPLGPCNLWNEAFRQMGAKHPNVSTGLGAVIIALYRFKPDVLYLAGFNKVWEPKSEGYQCTVPTPFNEGGTKDTGHDWQMESELLPYLAAHYQSRISDLAGNHDIQPTGIRTVRKPLPAIPAEALSGEGGRLHRAADPA